MSETSSELDRALKALMSRPPTPKCNENEVLGSPTPEADDAPNAPSWTTEWPDREGHYWFWGHRSGWSTEKRHYVVRAWTNSVGLVFVSSEGFDFCPEMHPRGHWQRIPEPELPGE